MTSLENTIKAMRAGQQTTDSNTPSKTLTRCAYTLIFAISSYGVYKLFKKLHSDYSANKVEPRYIYDRYMIYSPDAYVVRSLNRTEFQKYLRQSIKFLKPNSVLCALDLDPDNFSLLSCEQMTEDIMRRAFELDINNIKCLLKIPPSEFLEKYLSSVGASLEHAGCIHGVENVSNMIKQISNKSEISSHIEKTWDACVYTNNRSSHIKFNKRPLPDDTSICYESVYILECFI
jgi:hypothetical protein